MGSNMHKKAGMETVVAKDSGVCFYCKDAVDDEKNKDKFPAIMCMMPEAL